MNITALLDINPIAIAVLVIALVTALFVLTVGAISRSGPNSFMWHD